MSTVWPEAKFYPHESGSQTPATFAAMLEECYLIPMRQRVPDYKKRLLLWMDSGGGALLHLSVPVAVLCERYCCDVFLIPSYATKAMCALDQAPYAKMSDLWATFTRQYAQQTGNDLTIFPALKALQSICKDSLLPAMARAGWAHIGFAKSCPVDRNKILVERFEESFQSKRAGGGLAKRPTSKAAHALDLVAKVSPKKERCTAEGYKAVFSVAYKFCPTCGAENAKHDPQERMLTSAGKNLVG